MNEIQNTDRSSHSEVLFVRLDFRDLGSLNWNSLREARDVLLATVAKARSRTVAVDINARRAGAAFAGILVEAAKQSREHGGELLVQSASPLVWETLELCKVRCRPLDLFSVCRREETRQRSDVLLAEQTTTTDRITYEQTARF